MTGLIVVTMGQGTAERYEPGDRELCVSITTPGCSDARLSARFIEVLRLAFVDYPWERWRDAPSNITDGQAAAVVALIARHPTARRLVIHCTAGASRSVSMAMALEADGLAAYEKPEWWGKISGQDNPAAGWVPNRGVYVRVRRAARYPLR
jgi:predicted protein tyrosine phosphatase